jgi:hypothetical protein
MSAARASTAARRSRSASSARLSLVELDASKAEHCLLVQPATGCPSNSARCPPPARRRRRTLRAPAPGAAERLPSSLDSSTSSSMEHLPPHLQVPAQRASMRGAGRRVSAETARLPALRWRASAAAVSPRAKLARIAAGVVAKPSTAACSERERSAASAVSGTELSSTRTPTASSVNRRDRKSGLVQGDSPGHVRQPLTTQRDQCSRAADVATPAFEIRPIRPCRSPESDPTASLSADVFYWRRYHDMSATSGAAVYQSSAAIRRAP